MLRQGSGDFFGIDGSEIKGVEFDFQASISDDLSVNGGLGLIDSQFGLDSLDVLRDTGETATVAFVDTFSYAPDISFTLGANYNIPLNTDRWDADMFVGYSYQDDMQTSSNVEDNTVIPGYGLLDANLTLARLSDSGDSSVKLTVWGKNLTDKEYYVSNLSSFAFAGIGEFVEFGDPRTFGLTLTLEK